MNLYALKNLGHMKEFKKEKHNNLMSKNQINNPLCHQVDLNL
jgi:hypothetical protein